MYRRKSTCQIVDYDSEMCVIEITWNEALESLLSGGIPELESNDFACDSNIFGNEIDSDGGLYSWRRYIFGGVEFVLDVSGDDGALADVLISNQNNFKLLDGVTVTRETYLVVHYF